MNFNKCLINNFRSLRILGLQFIKYKIAYLTGSICKIKPKCFKKSIELRMGTSDYLVFEQIVTNKSYEFEIGFTPMTIIDCGANIGLASIYFANKYPNANILAIESASSNYDMLVKNTSDYHKITCINKGVWYKSCFLEIDNIDNSNWGMGVKETNRITNLHAVSILDLITEYHISQIDILKIDIEGSEKVLFENDSDLWLPFVRVLVIELHDRIKKGCSNSLFRALFPYEYELEIKGDNLIIIFQHN